jgi:hypothetical protein
MNPMLLATVVAGIALGVWHLDLAAHAIFVFRSGEPISSWAAILIGPASTLPAAVTAFFLRRPAAYWLMAGGIVSFLVFIFGERGITDNVFPYLWKISVPMIVLGGMFAYLPQKKAIPPP